MKFSKTHYLHSIKHTDGDLFFELGDELEQDSSYLASDEQLTYKYGQVSKSTITDPTNRTLSMPALCDCGEAIDVTVEEVLSFDSVECPNCGTDTYYSEAQYNEAHNIISRG